MPHLVILYSGNLDAQAKLDVLCRQLADTMLTARDENNQAVFPPGGIRVLAYPAPHYAIADGGQQGILAGQSGQYGFAYLNLRMGKGRTSATQTAVGNALMEVTRRFFAPLVSDPQQAVGVTLQIDVGAEVFDAKSSSLHTLFQPPSIT